MELDKLTPDSFDKLVNLEIDLYSILKKMSCNFHPRLEKTITVNYYEGDISADIFVCCPAFAEEVNLSLLDLDYALQVFYLKPDNTRRLDFKNKDSLR